MTTSTALMLTVFLGPVISAAIWLCLGGSLRSSLDAASDGVEGVRFWATYAALMLFIVPLLTGLIIGVGSIPHDGVYPATGMTRVLTSILAGAFIALAVIGTKLANYSRMMTNARITRDAIKRREF